MQKAQESFSGIIQDRNDWPCGYFPTNCNSYPIIGNVYNTKCRIYITSTMHPEYFRNIICRKSTIWRKLTMRAPALYYYCLAAFCVASLFIGMAHAADLTPAVTNPAKIHVSGYGNSAMPRLNFSCLEQQGVTATDVKAALKLNDTALFRKWSDTCSQSVDGISGNATHRQQQKPGTGTGTSAWNETKAFPARHLPGNGTFSGITPGSWGGNITGKHLVPGSDIRTQEKSQLNGTIMPSSPMNHALNRSSINPAYNQQFKNFIKTPAGMHETGN
jgi:hypothetical protein